MRAEERSSAQIRTFLKLLLQFRVEAMLLGARSKLAVIGNGERCLARHLKIKAGFDHCGVARERRDGDCERRAAGERELRDRSGITERMLPAERAAPGREH